VVKSEKGDETLQKALFAIFGRSTEILAMCNSTETLGALCPSTLRSRNINTNTSATRNTADGNASLHIDFRTKIREGNAEDAREVLAEMAKLETGDVDTLSEAADEVEMAFTRLNNSALSIAPVVVLSTPQPRQLKYMTPGAPKKGVGQTSLKNNPETTQEDESDVSLGALEGVVIAVVSVLLGLLVLALGYRHTQRRHARPKEGVDGNGEKAQKVDPCLAVDDMSPTCLSSQLEESLPAELGAKQDTSQVVAGTEGVTLKVCSPRAPRNLADDTSVASGLEHDPQDAEMPVDPEVSDSRCDFGDTSTTCLLVSETVPLANECQSRSGEDHFDC